MRRARPAAAIPPLVLLASASFVVGAAAQGDVAQGGSDLRPLPELLIVNRGRGRIGDFEVSQDGVVAKLRAPLRGGHQVRLPLTGFTSCAAVYQYAYENLPPASREIDVCRQGTVNVINE